MVSRIGLALRGTQFGPPHSGQRADSFPELRIGWDEGAGVGMGSPDEKHRQVNLDPASKGGRAAPNGATRTLAYPMHNCKRSLRNEAREDSLDTKTEHNA